MRNKLLVILLALTLVLCGALAVACDPSKTVTCRLDSYIGGVEQIRLEKDGETIATLSEKELEAHDIPTGEIKITVVTQNGAIVSNLILIVDANKYDLRQESETEYCCSCTVSKDFSIGLEGEVNIVDVKIVRFGTDSPVKKIEVTVGETYPIPMTVEAEGIDIEHLPFVVEYSQKGVVEAEIVFGDGIPTCLIKAGNVPGEVTVKVKVGAKSAECYVVVKEESGEVTPNQWQNALHRDSFSTMTATATLGDGKTTVLKTHLGTQRFYFTTDDGTEVYVEGKYYGYDIYTKKATESKFVKESINGKLDDVLLNTDQLFVLSFSLAYEQFSYNEQTKSYEGPDGVVLKFSDGKLKSMTVDGVTTEYSYVPEEVTLPSQSDVIYYEVSSDSAWNAALRYSTANVTAAVSYESGATATFKLDAANDKFYFVEDGTEYYYASTTENNVSSYFRYVKGAQDAQFELSSLTNVIYERDLDSLLPLIPFTGNLSERKYSFDFDSTTHSYKADENDIYNLPAKVELFFENDVLTKAIFTVDDETFTATYTHGSAEITLPAQYLLSAEVDRMQWSNALYENLYGVYTVKRDNETLFVSTVDTSDLFAVTKGAETFIVQTTGEGNYVFVKNGESWTRTLIDGNNCSFAKNTYVTPYTNILQNLANDYDRFTYGADKKYHGENGEVLAFEGGRLVSAQFADADQYVVTADFKTANTVTVPTQYKTDNTLAYIKIQNKQEWKVAVADNEATAVNILASFLGLPVTQVGDFGSSEKLTTVTMPSSVTSMVDSAFYNCVELTSVTLSASLKKIPYSAFCGCTKLASITIPSTVTEIQGSAFFGCTALASIDLSGVQIIDGSAFKGCTSLANITFGNSLQSIGYEAFRNCALKNVVIPNSVEEIGRGAFALNDAMTSLTLPFAGLLEDTEHPENTTFGLLFTKSSNSSYLSAGAEVPQSLKSVTITGATVIRTFAFYGCGYVTRITIPNTVTEIGQFAFAGCNSLEEINLPSSLKKIGYHAFAGCLALEEVVVPDSVTEIEREAFYNCGKIKSITLPFVGKDALYNPSKNDYDTYYNYSLAYHFGDSNNQFSGNGNVPFTLTKVIVTSGKNICPTAFANCKSIVEVILPTTLQYIGYQAFNGCEALATINIPDGVTDVGENAFTGTAWYSAQPNGLVYAGKVLYTRKGYDSAYTPEIAQGTIAIAESAFYNDKLIQSVSIPESVQYIGYRAFCGCDNLKTVAIGNGVKSIGKNAFYACNNLTDLNIGTSVKLIDEEAFCGCSALESVIIPSNVKEIGTMTFSRCSKLANVTLNEGLTRIDGSAFEYCTKLTSITLPQSLTYLGGAAFYRSGLTSITIPSGITALLENTFVQCEGLTSVTLSEGLETIGDSVFNYCTNLAEITIPDSVMRMGRGVFTGTAWYNAQPDGVVYAGKVACAYKGTLAENTTVTIKDGTLSIADCLFALSSGQDTKALVGLTLPSSLQYIGDSAFSRRAALKEVALPDSLTFIGAEAFYNCQNLKINGLPSSLTTVGDSAFKYCSSLGTWALSLPGQNVTIGEYAFSESQITSVTLGQNATIGERAFSGCILITTLTIPSGATVDYLAFAACEKLAEVTVGENSVLNGGAFAECSNLKVLRVLSGAKVGSISLDLQELYVAENAEISTAHSLKITCSWDTWLTLQNDNYELESLTIIGDKPVVFTDLVWLSSLKEFNVDNETQTSEGGIVYNKAKTEVLYIPKKIAGEVTIADGVTSLGDISDYSEITLLTVPASVTEIGNVTDCANLVSVSFPEGLDVSHVTFANCPKFKGFLNGDAYVKDNVLTGVKNGVVSVIVPSDITAIGAEAFKDTDVKYVFVPDGVTVEQNAFAHANIKAVFYGGNNILGNPNTTTVKVSFNKSCTADGWIYDDGGSGVSIIAYIGEGGEISIPAQINGKDVTQTTQSQSIPYAFLERDDITKITVNSTTLNVVAGTFANLSALTEIELGEGLQSFTLSKITFTGCTNLTKISIAGGYDGYKLIKVKYATESGGIPTYSVETFASAEDVLAKVMSAEDGAACTIGTATYVDYMANMFSQLQNQGGRS